MEFEQEQKACVSGSLGGFGSDSMRSAIAVVFGVGLLSLPALPPPPPPPLPLHIQGVVIDGSSASEVSYRVDLDSIPTRPRR